MRVRTHLSLLAAAVFLPMLLGSALAIKLLLDAEREAVLRSMQELARATVLAMDQELTAADASARALATSIALRRGDFQVFYGQARAANAGSARNTALLRPDAQQVFNTVLPFGASIAAPAAAARQRVRAVFEQGRASISGLQVGSATRSYIVAVELPLQLADGSRVLLDQWVPARALNARLAREAPPSWLITVFDRDGLTLARNRHWEEYVAGRARPELLLALRSGGAGPVQSESRDGVPVTAVSARSALSGWHAVVAVPAAEMDAIALHAVALTAATLLCALTVALAGALWFARRLLDGTEYLGAATEGMAEGWLPPPADLRIAELNKLQQVLHTASTRLIRLDGARRRHLAEAESARSLAEQQNRAKDEFLAMLGHELRNPLGAISSAIALIQMGAGSPAIERAHAIIARQSRHLAHLVDELLDANRVLSGKVALAPVPLDLAGAVREVVSTLQGQGTTADRSVELALAPSWALCDPHRLQQIAGNLVENAAKYSQAGATIRVSTRALDGWAELVVADNGRGIDADLLPRVWEVFVQGKEKNRNKGGLGIGLAVVRSLVEQQGGTVAVESAGAGCGSSFSVRLPAALPVLAAVQAAAPAPRSYGLHVLVVEDNPDLRDMMCALLLGFGCTVAAAADGAGAIALAAANRPRIAFVDIDLPDMSGHEVARALARQGGIRLVAVTGYGQPDDVRLALAAGFERHLKKPLRIEDIEQVLVNADQLVQ